MKWNEMTWNEMKWNEWMNKWNEMNEWKNIEWRKEGRIEMNEWLNDWLNELIKILINKLMNGCNECNGMLCSLMLCMYVCNVCMYLYSVSMCQTHKICIYTYTAPWLWSLLPLTLTIPIWPSENFAPDAAVAGWRHSRAGISRVQGSRASCNGGRCRYDYIIYVFVHNIIYI